MKLAIIADIHGNALALEAVLADIKRHQVDDILNLGDHLSGPLEAKRTADILINSHMISISGNHDRTMVDLTFDEMGKSDQAAYRQLDATHVNWLRELKDTHLYNDEIFMCHGSPKSNLDMWMEQIMPNGAFALASQNQIENYAIGINHPIILCGHTHIPRIVRLSGGRILINPGSVGFPAFGEKEPVDFYMQNGIPDACYVILEKISNQWMPSFHYVPYDSLAAAEMAKIAGFDDWVSGLTTGWYQKH
ncbi:MAG: metallophosphoesterase family protein [Rhizobiales bacterium]|nr:metallophosphoesterase family protein [Hyphomicrobiales bacterium]